MGRERALERSIESAWSTVFPSGPNPFTGSAEQLWDPNKNAPALLLNATEVETGERVVIAPWRLESLETPALHSLSDRHPNEVPLSTAVGLSARFPFLTPAGWFSTKSGEVSLVDGGYSDNSGVATALDVINQLKQWDDYKFIVIALVSESARSQPNQLFAEFASPLRALDSTRSARGRSAVDQAEFYLNGSRCSETAAGPGSDCITARMRTAILATGDVRLPLGWVLSSRSRQAIEASFGQSDECRKTADLSSASPDEWQRCHNKQLIEQIGKDLGY
ncbi:MAG TPA: hypothetical protein VKG22_09875 [Stellaceae bacterium]|nr:hypothetical protein [Stellaceae bacterium]